MDYKDLIEELRAEIDKLEAGAATRLNALLDQLVGHGADSGTETKTAKAPTTDS